MSAILPPDSFISLPDGYRFALALFVLFFLRPSLILNSWYRSPVQNNAVGGVQDSLHLEGQAADVDWLGADLQSFEEIAQLYLDIGGALGLDPGALVYFGQGKSYLHLQSRRLRSGASLSIVS